MKHYLYIKCLACVYIYYAGGRNEVNKAPWIMAYMTINVTIPRPVPEVLGSDRHEATHQYHTAYPADTRVIICTWYDVMANKATTA